MIVYDALWMTLNSLGFLKKVCLGCDLLHLECYCQCGINFFFKKEFGTDPI
jgi:hypothetical protein